jgi:hypothetical protein
MEIEGKKGNLCSFIRIIVYSMAGFEEVLCVIFTSF